MSEELKPCPFCKCTPHAYIDFVGDHVISCENMGCPVVVSSSHHNYDEAVANWNTRHEAEK